MSSMRRTSSIGLALALATSACKESVVEPGAPLDLEETAALFAGIGARMNDTTNVISSSEDGFVGECPLGGLVTGDVEVARGMEEADTLHQELDFTLVAERCGFQSRNLDFTITGNVILNYAFWFVDSLPVKVDGGVKGSVDWQLEDRSGTCGIDLALRQDTGGTFSGTMCGLEVDLSFESFISAGSGGARWSLPGSSTAAALHPPAK